MSPQSKSNSLTLSPSRELITQYIAGRTICLCAFDGIIKSIKSNNIPTDILEIILGKYIYTILPPQGQPDFIPFFFNFIALLQKGINSPQIFINPHLPYFLVLKRISDNGEYIFIEFIPIENMESSESSIIYDKLLKTSHDGILAYDNKYRYILWNPAMERISGVRKDQVLGKIAFEVFPFLKEQGEDFYFNKALSGDSVVSRNRKYFIEENNKKGYYEGHYSPLYGENGKIVGGFVIIKELFLREDNETLEADSYNIDTLNNQQEKIIGILKRMSDSYISINHELIITSSNNQTGKIFNLDIKKITGKNFLDVFPTFSSEQLVHQGARSSLYLGRYDMWVNFLVEQTEEGFSIYMQDITKQKLDEAQLETRILQREELSKFGQKALTGIPTEKLMAIASDLISTTLKHSIVHIFINTNSKTGLRLAATQGGAKKDIGKYLTEKNVKLLTSGGDIKESVNVKIIGRKNQLGIINVNKKVEEHFSPDDMYFLETISNIIGLSAQRQKYLEQIKINALSDDLTKLPNKIAFTKTLNLAIRQAKINRSNIVVLIIDLDNFKSINDSLGHKIGDQLLQKLSVKLSETIKSCDIVSRFGGDEFVLFINNIYDKSQAQAIVDRILSNFQNTITVGNLELSVQASIGVSIFPIDGLDTHTLIRNADIALYKAKDKGRNQAAFYDQFMHAYTNKRFKIGYDLKQAIDKKSFEIYYQPIIDVQTGECHSVETLIRWNHPTLGFLRPSNFINIAEETGLIIPIGELLFHDICKQISKWQKDKPLMFQFSINLSLKQLGYPMLLKSIKEAIALYHINPQSLIFEITETVAMKGVERDYSVFNELRNLGAKLSIDDFGIGYSSFAHLKKLPIDQLKIDKSFLKGCPNQKADVEIVKTIITLAHNLNLKVVAEGIEHEDQLTFLKTTSCDKAQGFFFSPPFPALEFEQNYIN